MYARPSRLTDIRSTNNMIILGGKKKKPSRCKHNASSPVMQQQTLRVFDDRELHKRNRKTIFM
ncbi:hypothetical protein NC653_036208 [Populus alba x Populus x berolinensis]|uniref:Uncharacterized protein n=1 Tax=Populus alba x Populus x berolinensis TaxID=444605 RepID=A0AAD6LLZ6_9ROSI|nr:hypothetical protein NC653_036208 [Populus alba x Populus x berolinensis]